MGDSQARPDVLARRAEMGELRQPLAGTDYRVGVALCNSWRGLAGDVRVDIYQVVLRLGREDNCVPLHDCLVACRRAAANRARTCNAVTARLGSALSAS